MNHPSAESARNQDQPEHVGGIATTFMVDLLCKEFSPAQLREIARMLYERNPER